MKVHLERMKMVHQSNIVAEGGKHEEKLNYLYYCCLCM
jgi:hypothetical protein